MASVDKKGKGKSGRRSKATKAAGKSEHPPKPHSKRGSNKFGRNVRNVDKPGKPSLLRFLLVRLTVLIVLIGLLPFILTLIYIPASIHPVSTLMVANWSFGATVNRRWVPLEEISPFVTQSVISSEDGQFCSHGGVDWAAVNLVVDDLIEGERPRGASTIAMQTVKNLFLWPNRSYVRKALEVPLALYADMIWSKPRMMEIYLNIAEWGPGQYGIEAAARHHFKKSAKRLSRRQAALLAVTLPNPIARNPRKPGRGMKRLVRLVEKRAKQSGAYVKCLK